MVLQFYYSKSKGKQGFRLNRTGTGRKIDMAIEIVKVSAATIVFAVLFHLLQSITTAT